MSVVAIFYFTCDKIVYSNWIWSKLNFQTCLIDNKTVHEHVFCEPCDGPCGMEKESAFNEKRKITHTRIQVIRWNDNIKEKKSLRKECNKTTHGMSWENEKEISKKFKIDKYSVDENVHDKLVITENYIKRTQNHIREKRMNERKKEKEKTGKYLTRKYHRYFNVLIKTCFYIHNSI